MNLEKMETTKSEIRMLKQRIESANLYHQEIEEFNNWKMKYAFIKIKLLIYQQRSNKSQIEQWALHKDKVVQIILESFKTYQKDEEFY